MSSAVVVPITKCFKRSNFFFWLALIGFLLVFLVFILLLVWIISPGYGAGQGYGIASLVLSGLAIIFCLVGAIGCYGVWKCPESVCMIRQQAGCAPQVGCPR